MPSIKHIKRRITSVKGTKQIIKAMNLVAASKLQKYKQRLDAVRPMFTDMQGIMNAVRNFDGAGDNVYFRERKEVKSVAYIVVTSDRGLCGGYNVNLAKEALRFMKENNPDSEKSETIITAGSRGMLYLARRGKAGSHRFQGPTEHSFISDSQHIGKLICGMYLNGEIDEAYVIYTKFKSVLTHIPSTVRILPIGDAGEGGGTGRSMLFDPNLDNFLEYAVPLYINTFLGGVLVEASVCEEASRMTSMEAADKNAVDIIDDLTLIYNRTRQGIITQEITEIVSGANALQ